MIIVGNRTSTTVKSLETANGTYTYTYDAVGNILSINDGTYTVSYVYDGLNQLVRENDQRADTTTVYTYTNGNITGKKVYKYTLGNVGEEIKSSSYGYSNSEWRDLLTSFNGQAVTYDEIGNPITFGSKTFEWCGRQLERITDGDNTYVYSYNTDGDRVSKTVNGVKTEYFYNGSILAGQKTGDETLIFMYDNNGDAFGFNYNGEEYYYIKNVQNDIVAIADKNGTVVANYYYDAWGNVTRITGDTALAQTNPLRYRSYYYDSETGYYHLKSRYYSPEVGRFLNADGYLAELGGNINGYNLFAYCFNNPVNLSDEKGAWPSWATKLAIGIGAIVVGAAVVAATAATGGAAAAFVGAAVAGLKAAAVSGAIGAAVGAGMRAVRHRTSTGGWSGAGKAAVNGAVEGFANGFMTGGIMAGGSQILSSGFKVAANAGVPTGRNGGLTIGNRTRVLSPNHPQAYEAGGTLLKIGNKYKNIRFDVGSKSLFHMNIQLTKTVNYHLPIGVFGAGLWGGVMRD